MATKLSGFPLVSPQDLTVSSKTQLMNTGTYMETADGRGFRYVLNGAVATVPGKLYVAPAWDGTNQAPVGGLAVAAAAAGTNQVTLTGSLTLAAGLLTGGYLATDVTPGQGYTYLINNNTAVAAAANCVITLADPLVVALTASSTVVLAQANWSNIVISPAGASTGSPVGVAYTAITAAQWGWVQTFGAAGTLIGVATSISLPGVPVAPSAATAGSVIVSTAVLPTVGWAMQLCTATEYDLVYLNIH